MSKPSVFTPIGLWRLSTKPPRAKLLYRTGIANLGGQFDTSKGAFWDAKIFADSLGQARADTRMESAAKQGIPHRASYMLSVREEEYGIIPGHRATMQDRRREFAARKLAPAGSALFQMVEALQTLLGSDFVAFRPTSVASTVLMSQLDSLDVNYQLPGVARKLVRLTNPVSLPGVAAQWVDYTAETSLAAAGQSLDIIVGEKIVVEPGRLGRAELVTVVETAHATFPVTIRRFKAVFTKSHDAGSLGTTAPFPAESRNKRHSLVIVKQAAAGNPETRRRIDELMRRMMRDTSTWDIVEQDPAASTQTKRFLIGEPSLGRRTAFTVSI